MVSSAHNAAKLDLSGPHARSHFFSLSLDLLCIADLDGTIRDISSSVRSILGYEEQELVGTPYMRLIHPDDVSRVRELLDALRRGEDAIDFNVRALRKDGSSC